MTLQSITLLSHISCMSPVMISIILARNNTRYITYSLLYSLIHKGPRLSLLLYGRENFHLAHSCPSTWIWCAQWQVLSSLFHKDNFCRHQSLQYFIVPSCQKTIHLSYMKDVHDNRVIIHGIFFGWVCPVNMFTNKYICAWLDAIFMTNEMQPSVNPHASYDAL